MDRKEFRKPATNQLRVSKRGGVNRWVFLSKIYFKLFAEVELHALGEAINLAVRAAENLQRKGFCSITKLETLTVLLDRHRDTDEDNKDKEESEKRPPVKKHKVD